MSARLATVMVMVAGCTDPEPATWGDAQQAWAASWCEFAARCDPDEFAGAFATAASCEDSVASLNCDSYGYCSERYPHSSSMLSACEADMASLVCTARYAPQSCYRAFASD